LAAEPIEKNGLGDSIEKNGLGDAVEAEASVEINRVPSRTIHIEGVRPRQSLGVVCWGRQLASDAGRGDA
jgi:hypothetical protein